MVTAEEALQRLREGNQRFVSGIRGVDALLSQSRRADLVAGQAPFAAFLGCADSRVPVEMIFDQGPGDLFVVRVAGNIVAPSQIGSIEYAVERFGTRLVVLMGHTGCGAVHATLEELQMPSDEQSPNLRSIVERIGPSVKGLLEANPLPNPEELLAQAVRANIRASADHLRKSLELVNKKIPDARLLIVGAEYSLETGAVDFFDGVPEGA